MARSQDFYNLLKDESPSDAAALTLAGGKRIRKEGYTSYLSNKATREGGLDGLMDTDIKAKLGIIPKNFTWGQQSGDVFEALEGDFMKPRIQEVIIHFLNNFQCSPFQNKLTHKVQSVHKKDVVSLFKFRFI
jgi:serine carboxypeptidase 1